MYCTYTCRHDRSSYFIICIHMPFQVAIKSADISNPCRPWKICRVWCENIMEEFFRQGDLERSLNLPISFLCDRTTIVIPQAQKGIVCVCVNEIEMIMCVWECVCVCVCVCVCGSVYGSILCICMIFTNFTNYFFSPCRLHRFYCPSTISPLAGVH